MADGSACADNAAVAARLARRGIQVTDASDAARVELRVTPTPGGFEGTFTLATGDSAAPGAPRTLAAESCDEVLDAVSFALALALEHGEDAVPPAVQPPSVASPPATPGTPAAPAPPAITDAAPAPAATPEPARSPEDTTPERVVLGLALNAGAHAGVMPSPAFGVGVFGDVAWSRDGLSPSLRAGFLALAPASSSVGGYELRMALQAGSLDACPTRWTIARLSLVPCVRTRVGRLQALGRGFVGARLENGIWADLGVLLRAKLALGAHLDLEAEIAGNAPLTRPSFFFGNAEIYAVPAVGGQLGAGLGAHFP